MIEPDKTFVARVIYLEALMLLNERFYDDEWKARIAEYLGCRWPGYKGQRITAELLDEWMDWEEAAGGGPAQRNIPYVEMAESLVDAGIFGSYAS